MNDRLAGLSPQEKRALLVQTLRRKSGALDKLLDRVAVNVEDLEAEAVLDPEIQPNDASATTGPERVLLTGATGFLGSFLLSELLRRTRTDVYCLVRAADAEEGGERLRRVLRAYALWDEELSSRIVPVVGNLSEPLLGLGSRRFEELAGKIDAVYHSGASVN
jgi:FlaA1/EpsC-like NDP-sugar epimerase